MGCEGNYPCSSIAVPLIICYYRIITGNVSVYILKYPNYIWQGSYFMKLQDIFIPAMLALRGGWVPAKAGQGTGEHAAPTARPSPA